MLTYRHGRKGIAISRGLLLFSWYGYGAGDVYGIYLTAHQSGIDGDGDETPDWWEWAYFDSTAQTGTDDPDGDNYTNLEEYQNETDPLTFDIGPAMIWTAVEIGWKSVSGTNYQVQYTTDLLSNQWINLNRPVVGTGGTNTVFDSVRGVDQRFYRVTVTN